MGGGIYPHPPNIFGSVGNFLFHSVKIAAVGKSRKRPFDACRAQRSYNTSLATISGIYEFNRLHRPRRPPRRIDQAPETTLVQDIHTHYRKEMINLFSIVWPRNSVMCKGQLKVLHNLLPASSGVERGAGGGGLVPRGPGQLWGPGTSWIIFYFFDRKSVGDPGF